MKNDKDKDIFIGNTRMLVLEERIKKNRILLKMENENPTLSMKDRGAWGMITSAESKGIIDVFTEIIESSSGNMATALARLCSIKNYQFTAIMDKHASKYKIDEVKKYNGSVKLIDNCVRGELIPGTVERMRYAKKKAFNGHGKVYYCNQYENVDNFNSYKILGREIYF